MRDETPSVTLCGRTSHLRDGARNYTEKERLLRALRFGRMGRSRGSSTARSSTSQFNGPPETERILLKSKKFVNASFGYGEFCPLAKQLSSSLEGKVACRKKNCKNLLALGKSCDKLAP
jgi:hypothetical protein